MDDNVASEWIFRWRTSRGSPPDTPTDDAFGVLAAMPEDMVLAAADATGDDAERVRWWKAIARDPARHRLAGLRMTQVPVYVALRDTGPMTDDELVAHLGRKKSETSPRRIELVRLGLIREVEKRMTSAGRKSAAWGVVPAEEVDDARRAARERGLRRKHLDKYSLPEKVQIVQHLLGNDDVNAALLQDHSRSKGKDRARREARAEQVERDRARRDFNERVRQAERDASPQLVYLKAVRQLRNAADAIREMKRVIDENIESQYLFGSADIGPEHWPEVRQELQHIIDSASTADDHLADVLGDRDDDALDVDEHEDAPILELEAISDEEVDG
ncbi:MAG: hypothetical protein JWO37_1001 [Acidimicrobiales bacterium]|nr:hypothetical protein [Acidimicrobiales bacterium]